ncbi:MAG: SLC13 family permease, partial [Trueperaceae bacterium]
MFAAFASDRFRLDLVAGAALLALAIPGVLDPAQALAGFAEPITLMIAGLFVVGAGLFQTGVADRLGDVLGRLAGRTPIRLTVVTMLIAALLSAFLSSTGTVAVLLPVVIGLARRADLAPGKLLMPLAFGSLLGGMLTLIGTPPNLVVADQLHQAGREPFGFFAFTPVGLVMLAIGVTYMATVGRRLLPDGSDDDGGRAPTMHDLAASYQVEDRLHPVRIGPDSDLRDRTLAASELRSTTGATVLAIESDTTDGRRVRRAEPSSLLRAGDVLHLLAEPDALQRIEEERLAASIGPDRPSLPTSAMLIEGLFPPRSSYVGQPLREGRLRDRTHATVVAMRRGDRLVHGRDLADWTIEAGDLALLAGGPDAQRRLVRHPDDLIPVGTPREWERFARDTRRAPLATLVLAAMLVVMTLGLASNVVAVLAAAFAMMALGAVRPAEAYRAIHWETVVLIAAVLPMATALEVTGGLAALTGGLASLLGDAGPLAVMAALFLLTSTLSQAISNTATTVLVAPIAFATAGTL